MTSRRTLVSLPDGVWKIIDNELKCQNCDGDSEVIRNIVINYSWYIQ
jgi:metal-responsive CopG/Arc/MetJ family transcriptional regulator